MDSTEIAEALQILVDELKARLNDCKDADSCFDVRNDYIDDVASTLKFVTEKVLSARIDALLEGREYEKEI
jgi:hypothetical protein